MIRALVAGLVLAWGVGGGAGAGGAEGPGDPARHRAPALEPIAAPPVAARAQSAPVTAVAAAPAPTLTVWLMTFGQGDEVWELFGHNAIRIRDLSRGTDIAYNWGMFSFEEPGFLVRFLTGENHYWMEGFPTEAMIEGYRRRNRSIWQQRLNLTEAQASALRDFIDWNGRPENRFYRYDYFLDNCSTRVRDALDRALGGVLRAQLASRPTGTTYRWHTRRLTQRDIPIYAGIEIALGQPADRPISAWEEGFLPVRLREHIRSVRVADSLGRAVPLVAEETETFRASRSPEATRPPSFLAGFVLAGALLAGIIAFAAHRASRGAGRGGFLAAAGLWSLLAGLLGVILVLAWTATRHIFWARNENLLQLSPLLLAVAVLVPALARRSRRASLAATLAALVAALSLLGLVLKALPLFCQVNGEIIALALPANLALAWGALRLTRNAEKRS